jgi:hypothetical protein
MRSVLASIFVLGLLITPCASGNAATAHHQRRHAIAPGAPDAGHGAGQAMARDRGSATPGYAVPGWSDEATRQWMGQYDSCKSIHCPG